jgi:HD-GYP domain-containing protein (c-di-GMP phosphodiesterase class II)
VRAHHERIDGRGYPDGLEGDAIPILSKIIAVSDSFHAMISKRTFREALPVPGALDELRAGIGKQFDPAVVGALLEIVQPSSATRAARRASL